MSETKVRQVSSGLNLVLKLKKPAPGQPDDRPDKLRELMGFLEKRRPDTNAALKRLNFVHFARFLPAEDGSTLGVITEFDGPLQPYVIDFIIAVGYEFTTILSYMEGWPVAGASADVRECPQAYWEYIREHNLVRLKGLPPFDDLNLYSAYPERTVIDIIGPNPATKREEFEPFDPLPPESPITLADVQCNLLRGVGARRAMHFALAVDSAAGARRLLASMTHGSATLPQVSTAERWPDDHWPDYRLTVGVTHDGLAALGVDAATLARFPAAFREGPSQWQRAAANGDVGSSAPQEWELGAPGQPVHLMVTLYGYKDKGTSTGKKKAFEKHLKALNAAWTSHGLTVLYQREAEAESRKEHFGFIDGISQPRVAGLKGSGSRGPDVQPEACTGEFLLGVGYKTVYGGSSLGNLPKALCQNASYAAVRVMRQDVAAFKKLIADAAAANNQTPDWIAERLMGRQYDGTPLSPVAAGGTVKGPSNTFDYAPSHNYPVLLNDHVGEKCPVGAHIRRMNPRNARVAGEPHSHRLMRRGLPYGPAWDDNNPDDADRGLFGMFVCADLERQFEFLMQVWANGDLATSGIRDTQDAIVGAQNLPDAKGEVGTFRIPTTTGEIALKVPRLVTTRGSLYLLMPGLGGLRHLSRLTGGVQAQPAAGGSAGAAKPGGGTGSPPATPTVVIKLNVKEWLKAEAAGTLPANAVLNTQSFNPKDPDFLHNPYPFYELFRRKAPVLDVVYGEYRSHWVFSHALVDEVCTRRNTQGELVFAKPPSPAKRLFATPAQRTHPDFLLPPAPDKRATEQPARGLFYMNSPEHGLARQALEPMVAQAFADVAAEAQAQAQAALASTGLAAKLKASQPFDVIAEYAAPATRNTLLKAMDVPPDRWDEVGKMVRATLFKFDVMLPDAQQAEAVKYGLQVAAELATVAKQVCPVHAGKSTGGLWCHMANSGIGLGGGLGNPAAREAILATAGNFVRAGSLPNEFLIGSALHLLLAGNGAGMAAYRKADVAGRARILAEVQRFESPFQLADRVATEDTSLGGVVLPKGTRVTVCFGAANHDPAVFSPDADTFNPSRTVNHAKNRVFGVGDHYCIGAEVALAMTQAVLDKLVDAVPKLTLAGPAQRVPDPYFRCFRALLLQP